MRDGFGSMNRRDAMRALGSLVLGGFALASVEALIGAREAGAAPAESGRAAELSADEIALLDELAETILPQTATPGARAAGVGAFMALMVRDALRPAEQHVFREGLVKLEALSNAQYGAGFLRADAAQRVELVGRLDLEQFEYMRTHADDSPAHWFRMIKGLALFGYFTSEIGYTQMARYAETPGRYEPAAPRAPGEKNFARHASEIGAGRPPVTTDSRQCRPRAGAACP